MWGVVVVEGREKENLKKKGIEKGKEKGKFKEKDEKKQSLTLRDFMSIFLQRLLD
jgi:hypothetical protein